MRQFTKLELRPTEPELLASFRVMRQRTAVTPRVAPARMPTQLEITQSTT